MSSAKQQIQKLLEPVGIQINGHNEWDPKVYNELLYSRILSGGSLALGETYMDGWWDVKALDQFFYKVLSANLQKKIGLSLPLLLQFLKSLVTNPQTPSRSFKVGQQHYDIGNDIYRAMLDKRLTYTCGYWKNAKTLDEAQEAKLDLVCKKIGLKSGDNILDIGCGWGSFLKYAAEKYGIKGTGVTVSKEQMILGQKLCAGLPIELKLEDYRNTQGTFDHIVSLGMFEHVGVKNYHTYMRKVHKLLKDDGFFLLHTMGLNHAPSNDPWVEKYIFPNSMVPSIAQIGKSIERLFIMEDWHNFGPDYDKTLMAWFHNFDRSWPKLKEKYSEQFYRMWKYYLMIFASNFRVRNIQLWQIVLSKNGVPDGYTSIR